MIHGEDIGRVGIHPIVNARSCEQAADAKLRDKPVGEEFFRTLPTSPGVYLMCGEREGVLYVGKALNLRKRLSSYRVANPERFPRRIIRLLHQVRRIELDICPSEAAAQHREEELICVLQPRFNRAGVVWRFQ